MRKKGDPIVCLIDNHVSKMWEEIIKLLLELTASKHPWPSAPLRRLLVFAEGGHAGE